MKRIIKLSAILFILVILPGRVFSQFLMDMVDTTTTMGRGMLGVYRKFDRIRIGGYLQSQFQIAGRNGIQSYEGGDFSSRVNNRFVLRRSRIRIDYVHLAENKEPGFQTAFQFEANERGFAVKDVWGRIFENNLKLFSFTAGMFPRPFGYEINLSSSERESPERGRMSQILMKGERDLGAMVSFEPRDRPGFPGKIKIDAGLFNGQGVTTNGDFDNRKDLIVRIALKSIPIFHWTTCSGGISWLNGGLLQSTGYVYRMETSGNRRTFFPDSGRAVLSGYAPRKYFGADAQLKMKSRIGYTIFRAEFITGLQPGTYDSSETPVSLLTGNNGYYIRNFSGAYLYFIQNVFNPRHEVFVKYDWYDPNSAVSGKEIGNAGSILSKADIRFGILGFGYICDLSQNIRLTAYYAMVRNEHTLLKDYLTDVPDDVLTFRLQFKY